jgi:1,2-diacylglycerol 3-beta-galactosyltransferase
MTSLKPDKPHILFLFSDTGGGHRSAAEALIEALHLEFPQRLTTEMVDLFREYSPAPLRWAPDLYPQMVKVPQAWGLGWHVSNGSRRARLIGASAWPYVRRSLKMLFAEHPADLIVSVHPLMNGTPLQALGPNRPPFITVVTDLVSTHALWFYHRVDQCIVPSEEAHRYALRFGMPAERVEVVGLPVADRFIQPGLEKSEIRARLGWPQDRVVVLMVGGGDGMGPLEESAQAVARAGLKCAVAVVAGRNQGLKERLQAHEWPIPAFIYGFVHEMPDFMRAADVIVTKAGPGTICEAFIAGLPIILYSRLPGQEDGNVSYVVDHKAGFWSPHPAEIVESLTRLLNEPRLCEQMTAASRSLARPQAARQIARILGRAAGLEAD